MRDMYDTKMEQKAQFQEALSLQLDDLSLDLLRSADRLAWADTWPTKELDRWIEDTSAALENMKKARTRAEARA